MYRDDQLPPTGRTTARNEGHAAGYIPSLDGFRTVSIAFVFLGHSLRDLPIPGGFGVTIFFFISGFLITTLLLREIDKTGRIDFTAFYIRRLLRLGPPLLVTLALGVALVLAGVVPGSLNPIGLASQVLFFFNYWTQQSGDDVIAGMAILWSLSVEEHFYLVFPVLLLLSMLQRWPSWWLPVAAIAVMAWRIWKFEVLGFDEHAIYSLTDTRFDSLLWGCYLAVLCGPSIGPVPLFERGRQWLWLLGAVGVLLFCLVWRDAQFRSTLRYTFQGMALMPLFYFALRRPNQAVFKPLNWGWVRQIGVYSYTFYLVHYVVLVALRESPLAPYPLLIVAAAFAISLAYAAVLYRYVEQPVKRLRARYSAPTPAPIHEG